VCVDRDLLCRVCLVGFVPGSRTGYRFSNRSRDFVLIPRVSLLFLLARQEAASPLRLDSLS
jgi:hypothetical protein